MKKDRTVDNAKLGLFVLSGLVFFILVLYMIGRNRNLLGATFTVNVLMTNVNGLVQGNNVRFRGIDVGTVRSIHIEDDSSVVVSLIIDNKVKPYIKQNAIASVGTDGLMGNKLVNINSGAGNANPITEGEFLYSIRPVETDEMLRTLNTTNKNIERISSNLFEITEKLNSSNSLWTILSDTVIAKELKLAVSEFKNAGANTSRMTNTANRVVAKIENGNGIVYQLFMDTTLSQQLSHAVRQLDTTAQSTSTMMADLKRVMESVKQGKGPAGLVLSDSIFRDKLIRSAGNIEQGTNNFNQNMEALKTNFLFRRYFKKIEREKRNTTSTRKD
jgi:phospholipid/cholesterol/gamma-HCH transport system substrate-binding protein